MTVVELDPADRITADAVGPPGERVFYVQARQDSELVTVIVEKQQVQLLASSILEVLSRVDRETGVGPDEEEMGLEEPIEPLWHGGRLSIGYQEERDLLLLEIEELVPETAEGEPNEETVEGEPGREPDHVRVWATREQMLSFSRHGTLVCDRGRPACEFCGQPLDPGGHACPATNGHRTLGQP